MDRTSLSESLRTGQVEVTFRKVNGDIRVMTCTTDLNKVPPSKWPQESARHSQPEHLAPNLRVFDVKAQDWRSFIFENVIEVKPL
jgi:hypothetical protein